MTIIGLDDTDSRVDGMCTTYLATQIGRKIEAAGHAVDNYRLVRLNPAVKHKTRGNAALAIETDCPVSKAASVAKPLIDRTAIDTDPRTSPGLVIAPVSSENVPPEVASFSRQAVREIHDIETAVSLADTYGYDHYAWAGAGCTVAGRGRIGALAAIGAGAAFEEWTYEHISYREFDRCGTPRNIAYDSVFAAADSGYPTVWDTVDREENQAVCVPSAPGPILHGIRGDDPKACQRVAAQIDSERVDCATTFVTNQGTDAHLTSISAGSLTHGRGYLLSGVVESPPETKEGGHVFFHFATGESIEPQSLVCAAFEPTKRFRTHVRNLRVGDALTVCGEFTEGTLKLEKFAVRSLNQTAAVTPPCPDCDRRMKSAGRNAGYRCRKCGTTAPGKIETFVDRELETGWYEVPPCARRHIAKPLIRGGFDARTHPEK